MFNRIRRAVSHTRERFLRKGGHRLPLTPALPMVVHLVRPARPVPLMGRRRDLMEVIAGEKAALVRPYVLAIEVRARQRAATMVHEPFAYTCFASAEAF